ncbi:oxidoreductase family protein [Amylostereum chailletii]|nr:oxidoreductase family protein [Amylostereum chailletii]
MSSGFALIGAGLFATEAHLPAIAKLGRGETLKAIYSRSEKSASGLASAAQTMLNLASAPSVYFDGDASSDLDSLLARDDVFSVIVALPITAQPAVILKALAAGKHVLSEKPVAPDVASAVEMIKTYERDYEPKGLIWRVAEHFELESIYQKAGKIIKEGKIGKVLFFKALTKVYIDADSKYYKTPWRTIPEYQGGFLLDGGVHFAAALRVMLPSAVTHLSSFVSLNKDILAPLDTINAIVQAADGSHGIFEATFASPAPDYIEGNGYTITGSKGWLTVGPAPVQGGKSGLRIVLKTVSAKGEVNEEIFHEATQSIEDEIKSFLMAVEGQDDGVQKPRNALKDLAFIQAALNSKGVLIDLEALG